MSMVFGVPCPGCDRQMWVRSDGDVECATCERQYQARMGHLFPRVGQPEGRIAAGDPRETAGAS